MLNFIFNKNNINKLILHYIMKYLKQFDNKESLDSYESKNFITPHIFRDKQSKTNTYLEKYRLLEYISSTATGGQYIDLGCKLFENTDDFQIDVKFNIKDYGKNKEDQPTLIGNQLESSPYAGFCLRSNYDSSKYHLEISYIMKWDSNDDIAVKENGRNTWHLKNALEYSTTSNSWYTDQRKDGNYVYEFSTLFRNIPDSQINQLTTHLFCGLNSSNVPWRFVNADLYYLKITKGGKVIRDLIPVRNHKKIPGLYDKINKIFYRSQGDEEFEGSTIPGIIPYDSEIEYLEATGEQYILTDYHINNIGLKCEMIIQRIGNNTNQCGWIGRNTPGGFELYYRQDKGITLFFDTTNGDYDRTTNIFDNEIHNIQFEFTENYTYFNIDGNNFNDNHKGINNTHNGVIQLFAHKTTWFAEGRMYSCKLWDGEVMIYDLIPVRKGNVGYMYDKLSGKMFGNCNPTGAPFNLGPDK